MEQLGRKVEHILVNLSFRLLVFLGLKTLNTPLPVGPDTCFK